LVFEALEGRICPVLTLTQAGLNAGLGLSVFATGFPVASLGAMSVLFRDQGGELVCTFNGEVRLLPQDNDGQIITTIAPSQTYPGTTLALAQIGSHIYMTQQSPGKVVEINANGNSVQDIVPLPAAAGMVADPLTGQLFVDDTGGGRIYAVDPQAQTSKLFKNLGAAVYGLALSADGHTLYAALYANNQVAGYDVATGNLVFGPITVAGNPSGLALGAGRWAGQLYISTLTGTLVDLDLATLNQTLIASKGVRGDFLTFDPNDGALLVTQMDQIERLSFPAGPATSFQIDAPATFRAGTPFVVTLTAMDADGYVASGYTGTVRFTSSDAYPGLLPSAYTFTPSDNGTHNFGTVLFTTGVQTLTAEDTANSQITGSTTVMVQAAPANHLFTTAPLAPVAGTPFDVTVAALDPYGNVDTNYTGTVSFTSSDTDPGVLLPANYTFQLSDNGTHTFASGVTLITPGNQTITATDTASEITGSATIPVTSPAPPPGGGASGPRTPIPNGMRQTAQQVVLLDQLFSALSVQNPPLALAHAAYKGLVDAPLGGDEWLLGLAIR
jgi:hypothetical protein